MNARAALGAILAGSCMLWGAPRVAGAQEHHRRRHHHQHGDPPPPTGTPSTAPVPGPPTAAPPTEGSAVADPGMPVPQLVTTEPMTADVGPNPDPESIDGVREWASRQPLPAWATAPVVVRRWHASVAISGGYGLALGSDVLGLLWAGAVQSDPGFSGPAARLEAGAVRGPLILGISFPVFVSLGGGSDVPAVRPTLLGGAEAKFAYTFGLGRHVFLGPQISAGMTLVFVGAAVDAQGVAHRVSSVACPSGEATLLVSERLSGHLRLEQTVGVRAVLSEFLGGVAATAVFQLGIRYVL